MGFEEKDLIETTVRKIYTFKGHIINVRNDDVQLSNGHITSREIVEHRGGVGILPVTDDNCILMVKQYRYAYEEILMEIPAGKLEPGEAPFHTGIRELHEETGMEAETYYNLGIDYPSPGYCNEKISIFAATGLKQIGQKLDEGEFLNVVKVPYDKALQMVYDGTLTDSKTIIAILKFNEMRRAGTLKEMPKEAYPVED